MKNRKKNFIVIETKILNCKIRGSIAQNSEGQTGVQGVTERGCYELHISQKARKHTSFK